MEQLQKANSEKDISSAQALAELLKELARGEKSAEKQGYISFANAENLLCSLPVESETVLNQPKKASESIKVLFSVGRKETNHEKERKQR